MGGLIFRFPFPRASRRPPSLDKAVYDGAQAVIVVSAVGHHILDHECRRKALGRVGHHPRARRAEPAELAYGAVGPVVGRVDEGAHAVAVAVAALKPLRGVKFARIDAEVADVLKDDGEKTEVPAEPVKPVMNSLVL